MKTKCRQTSASPRSLGEGSNPNSARRRRSATAADAWEFRPPAPRLEDIRRRSGEASLAQPVSLVSSGLHSLRRFLGVALGLPVWLLTFALSAGAAVREVGPIGLTVGELDRALDFYTKDLPFELVAQTEARGAAYDQWVGLKGVHLRVAKLRLGDEFITLTEHRARKGRPIPADSRSFDHWFQHIAIVVRDMDAAYAHLRRHNVKHVSTLPQTLPDWNRAAGGIKAFYFRDPEDHVLEIIWFPPGKGDPKWQRLARSGGETSASLFLGIDHTAIVVSETDKSLAFYRDVLGLRVAGESENHGVEQEYLNQVFGARLRITALRAARGPGIEFLEYITPPGGRLLPAEAKANDLVFWHTQIIGDETGQLRAKLQGQGARFVSTATVSLREDSPFGGRGFIVRDPDGHALQFIERTAARVVGN
jgi:catechol 2,3-dioxygenase-like lactoylglutathione lyase family enzyme